MRGIMTSDLKPIVALLTVTMLAACGEAPAPPAEPGGVAIVGAQLIDGTGGDPVADSVIVIRDGRVEAAGPRETTAVPAGAEVIDAAGKTIIPGLMDLHTHYRGTTREEIEPQMKAQIYYGVTTARSIGSDDPAIVPFLLEANAGIPGLPRPYTAGRGFSAPNGFPPGNDRPQPETTEEARELVRGLAAEGVHFTKMWITEMTPPGQIMTPEMRTAIVEESIANGLIPVAHIDDESHGRQLIEAGTRDFLPPTVLTFGPGAGAPVDDPTPSDEFIQMCLDNEVSFTPTLSIIQNNWHFAEHPELLDDPDLRAVMNPATLARWDDPEVRAQVIEADNFQDRKAAFRQVLDFVKTMHDAGVQIALGDDAGTANVPMGWGVHHEMELYVEAGLTPMEAIVAATATSAGRMPPVGEADFGTLEPGKVADLVVLNADPLADITNTLEIDQVMRLGEWVERDGLLTQP
jgi:imidazolonepropionase-like amidohydrolase